MNKNRLGKAFFRLRRRGAVVLLGMLLIGITVQSQTVFRNPFDHPILLSGGFGELRTNHFHSGLDFKTKGQTGLPVHAVQKGYVSRISVNAWGYGNALYLDHPDGTTTVYGHLSRFNPLLAAYVKQKQYEKEQFKLDIALPPDSFVFAKGEVIAWSGNTGSSAGPHLHFEVRNTESEEVLDPLEYFRDRVNDHKPPRLKGVKFCPVEGEGVLNHSSNQRKMNVISAGGHTLKIRESLTGWGKIGLAIKAYDYMDNTANTYGVRLISLHVDGEEIYYSDINRFAFSDNHAVNSYVDYPEWRNHRSFYIRTFVEPGNHLPFVYAKHRGYIQIKEERTYQITCRLEDLKGNATVLKFEIKGKKQAIVPRDTTGRTLLRWNELNRFGTKGLRLTIPRGNLYDDCWMSLRTHRDTTDWSDTYTLNDVPVALDKSATLSLWLHQDKLLNKAQYGLILLWKGRSYWQPSHYKKHRVIGEITHLGTYKIGVDTVPPRIRPLSLASGLLRFQITDNLSGVESFRGEINGHYVLFTMDKRMRISYRMDAKRLKHGLQHLVLTVVDACGNESVYKRTFNW